VPGAGGLREVVQPFGADASQYKAELLSVLPILRQVSAAQKEIAEGQRAMQAAGGGAGASAAADIARVNAEIRQALSLAREYQPAMSAATTVTAGFGAAHAAAAAQVAATSAAIRAATVDVGALDAKFNAARASVAAMAADAMRANEQMAASFGRVRVSSDDAGDSVLVTARNLGLVRDTAKEATSALTGTAAALAAAQAAGGGSGAGPSTTAILGPALAAAVAQSAAARAAGSGGSGGGGTTRGGGGGFLGGAAGGALGGGGAGGGGSGGGFLGGFLGGALGGLNIPHSTATSQWRTAAAAIATWYPRIHWAMMLTNEVLATAGPAAIAALSAGAVGLEGGQTAYARGVGINAVGQSIGRSLGTTPGQFLGLGDSLQKAQTAADPMVWELAGAAINSVRAATDNASGGLQNFWQMGTSTIGMMDRFGAQVTLDFKNGLGRELSGAVAGGTQDLQQFGDVLGNVGDLALKVIPSLPGVGSDLLTTLQAGTKGLADAAGVLSATGLLGPTLALEAGSRYGPAIVGAGASLIGRIGQGFSGAGATALGGLLGTAGYAARAATEGDVAAGLAASVGDYVPAAEGAGLAGAIGGLGPLDIGALAAGTYLGVKGLTYKTPQQQAIAAAESQIGQDTFTQAAGAILSQINQLAPAASKPVSQGLTPTSLFASPSSPLRETLSGIGHANIPEALGGLGNFLGSLIGITSPTDQQAQASGAVANLTKQYGELMNAGQQLASVFKVSLPEAFQLANQSGLQLSTALGPNGKLTAVSLQQIANTQTGLARMTGGIGSPVYNAGVGAIQVSQGLAGSQLSTLNSAYDQVVANAAGGTTGAVNFSGQLQALAALGSALPAATAVTPEAAKKSAAAVAKALTGFTSPASQAAWAAFSSTSSSAPGVLQTVESMMDQLRTAQTAIPGFTQGQVAGAGAYEAKQLLPYAKSSPAALAQVGIISQELGGPAYQAGKSQAQNFAALSGYIDKTADSAKQYTATQNKMAVGMAGISSQAANFSSVLDTDLTNSMAAGVVGLEGGNKAMTAFASSVSGKNIDTGALKTVVSTLKAAGESAQSIQLMTKDAATARGATASQIAGIAAAVNADLGKTAVNFGAVASHAIAQGMKVNFALPQATGQEITFKSKVDPPVIPHVGDQIFNVNGHLHMPPVPKVPDQSFSIVGHVSIVGAGSATMTGGLGTAHFVGQRGFKVPGGYGGGDIVPAMLEPGELVVPKHMVAAGSVDHLRGSIPGFQSGGLVDPSVPYFASMGVAIRSAFEDVTQQLVADMQQLAQDVGSRGGSPGGLFSGGLQPSGGGNVPRGTLVSPVVVHVASVSPAVAAAGGGGGFLGAPAPLPAAAMKVIDSFEKSFAAMPGPWNKVASQILNGLLDGIRNGSKETASMAQALVSKVQTEIAFGRGVTSTAVSGLNFGGMQVATPATTSMGTPYQYYTDQQAIAAGGQPGSVQEQMGSYLQAMQSFQGDMSKLAKGGLEKRLMSQLYAAGPIQGDAEAQSILGGAGGIKAANQLYNQISSLATKLGVAAIGNVYGTPATHPALQGKSVKVGVSTDAAAAQAAINGIHGKSVTVEVNLHITGGGGAGGGISLTPSQIKSVASQVQSKLLSQAKNNRRTGTTLPGYGS
jgi:hypothetical protein